MDVPLSSRRAFLPSPHSTNITSRISLRSCSRADQQGKVFTTRFSPDPETPLTLAAAGSKATVQIWDVASNLGARKAFGDRLKKYGRELGEMKKGGGVIGIEDVDEEDD